VDVPDESTAQCVVDKLSACEAVDAYIKPEALPSDPSDSKAGRVDHWRAASMAERAFSLAIPVGRFLLIGCGCFASSGGTHFCKCSELRDGPRTIVVARGLVPCAWSASSHPSRERLPRKRQPDVQAQGTSPRATRNTVSLPLLLNSSPLLISSHLLVWNCYARTDLSARLERSV
jgi:hypothetical protein